MALRWKDIKQKSKEIINEFKQHRVGIIGLGIIVTLLLVGIFAPVLAPNTNERWPDAMEWRDNPKKAPPVWWDYFTSDKKAHHKVKTEAFEKTTEPYPVDRLADAGVEYKNISYKYNNEADDPAKDLITYISGTHDNEMRLKTGVGQYKNETYYPKIRVTVDRPDGRSIKLHEQEIKVNDTFGTAGDPLRFSFIKSVSTQNTLYRFGQQFYDSHTYDGDSTLRLNLNRTYDGAGNYVDHQTYQWNTSKNTTSHTERAPKIIAAYPGDGVEDFNINHKPFIQFSEPIDTSSFNYELTNNDPSGPEIEEVSTSWNWDNSTITFSPRNLTYGQTYTLEINTAEDKEGVSLEDTDPSFEFTTMEREHRFSLNRTNYTEYLKEGLINETLRDTFEDEGYNVSETAQVSERDGRWFISENGKKKYIIDEDTAELSIYELPEDTTDPQITRVHPTTDDSEIPKDQAITISFSEPMDKESFDYNYTMGGGSPTKDGVHKTWKHNGTVLHISHDSPVPDRVDVNWPRVIFGKANNDILNLNPDPLKGDYYFNISIEGVNIDVDLGEDASRFIFAGRVYGWMGTDYLGRDIALAWVWGARYALLLGGIVAITTVGIGTAYGMTSAYFGGWVDEIMQRGNEVVIGIPLLPMLIILMFIWRQSLWVMILLMCLLYWRGIAKTIRARGLQIKQSTFVEAAESLGAGSGRIITTHMIPQILPYSVAEAALIVPGVIVAEASLSVLGLGDPNIVTWGKLLSSAQNQSATVQGLWWWVLLPGLGITIVGFAFIATGMAIEKVVQPKMKQR